ncbi:MAG: hypothetical protein ACOYOJ_10615 [Alsobacter sp.]
MKTIKGLRSVYGLANRTWSMVLTLEGGEERRFDLDGPEHVETFIECFEQATDAVVDTTAGEVVFSYAYADLDADEDDEDDDDEDDAEEDEESDDRKDKDKGKR